MQYILPFSHIDKYHPDEFIVSNSNRLAYTTLKNWQNSFGKDPYKHTLLITGAGSCGKTYLAKLWQNLTNGFLIKDIFFDIEILSKYNNFIIEDIENWQETALLHLFNMINEQQKYLLLTISSQNKNFILPDLSSRIKSVFTVPISQLDDELMKLLIFKYFSTSSVILPQNVLDFLLNNLPRQPKEILKILEQINNFALISKRKINVALVKEVLALKR